MENILIVECTKFAWNVLENVLEWLFQSEFVILRNEWEINLKGNALTSKYSIFFQFSIENALKEKCSNRKLW